MQDIKELEATIFDLRQRLKQDNQHIKNGAGTMKNPQYEQYVSRIREARQQINQLNQGGSKTGEESETKDLSDFSRPKKYRYVHFA